MSPPLSARANDDLERYFPILAQVLRKPTFRGLHFFVKFFEQRCRLPVFMTKWERYAYVLKYGKLFVALSLQCESRGPVSTRIVADIATHILSFIHTGRNCIVTGPDGVVKIKHLRQIEIPNGILKKSFAESPLGLAIAHQEFRLRSAARLVEGLRPHVEVARNNMESDCTSVKSMVNFKFSRVVQLDLETRTFVGKMTKKQERDLWIIVDDYIRYAECHVAIIKANLSLRLIDTQFALCVEQIKMCMARYKLMTFRRGMTIPTKPQKHTKKPCKILDYSSRLRFNHRYDSYTNIEKKQEKMYKKLSLHQICKNAPLLKTNFKQLYDEISQHSDHLSYLNLKINELKAIISQNNDKIFRMKNMFNRVSAFIDKISQENIAMDMRRKRKECRKGKLSVASQNSYDDDFPPMK